MDLVQQTQHGACGIACLSMVSGKSMDEILEIMYAHGIKSKRALLQGRKPLLNTWARGIERTLDVMGIGHSEWSPKSWYAPRLHWGELVRTAQTSERNAFVGVNFDCAYSDQLGNGRGNWHWVIYDYERDGILDPLKPHPVIVRNQVKGRLYKIYKSMYLGEENAQARI